MEVNDSNEDDMDGYVQLSDRERYEPQKTLIGRIGSYSLNPSTDTQYIDSGDDSSVEDEYSNESMSRDCESSIYDIPNYSWRDDGAIKKNHSFQLPRNIRAIIVGKSGSGKTTLSSYL